jgi:hypothetical protein
MGVQTNLEIARGKKIVARGIAQQINALGNRRRHPGESGVTN